LIRKQGQTLNQLYKIQTTPTKILEGGAGKYNPLACARQRDGDGLPGRKLNHVTALQDLVASRFPNNFQEKIS
jgi:hypothetical protein